jgi:hypothetical protein
MTKMTLCFIFLLIANLIYAMDFTMIDNLHENKEHNEAMKILKENFNKSNPDPAIIWRMGREMHSIAKDIIDKKEKRIKYDEAIAFLLSYYNIKNGETRDRAKIIYWYTVNNADKAKTNGIKESLDKIPFLIKNCDNAIMIDPLYAEPYFLKAKIDDSVPFFLGGDKFRMSENFSKALKLEPDNYQFMIDGGHAYIDRGWNSDKKKKMAEKLGHDDGSPLDINDKEYGKMLLEKAVGLYNNSNNNTKTQEESIDEAKKILEKF